MRTATHDETDYVDDDLSEVAAGENPWVRRRFIRCRFVDADLRDLVTELCSFEDCDLTGVDLGDSLAFAAAHGLCVTPVHRAGRVVLRGWDA